MGLHENLQNRKTLIKALRAEVIGPEPNGPEVNIADKANLSWEVFRQPRRQVGGQEILWQDRPGKRYGAGILYPMGCFENAATEMAGEVAPGAEDSENLKDREQAAKHAESIGSRPGDTTNEADYDVSLANSYKPSSLGFSCLVDLAKTSKLVARLECSGRVGRSDVERHPCGTYRRLTVFVGDGRRQRALWYRAPLLNQQGECPELSFGSEELLAAAGPIRKPVAGAALNLEVIAVVRRWGGEPSPTHRLVTFALINRTPSEGPPDEKCLFQTGLTICGDVNSGCFSAYPETIAGQREVVGPLHDDAINRLLYRGSLTYGVGHGCGADWAGRGGSDVPDTIWTDLMPVFETPSTSADLERFIPGEDRWESLAVDMRKLAGLKVGDNGQGEIDRLAEAYSVWIENLETQNQPSLTPDMRQTAEGLIDRCRLCLRRIQAGISLLSEDSERGELTRSAFRYANLAMLQSQLRSGSALREPVTNDRGMRTGWSEPYHESPNDDGSRGFWRPFQIAFLLMSLHGIVDDESDDRETVDLIWFPTGGGKTEAYLGLTAFALFFYALQKRSFAGATVLMRYTLRLLTAQQFQRASTLFCAMEHIRTANPDIRAKPFRIGLWVGGDSTPNTREQARESLRKLIRNPEADNPFILLRCPWCGARMGPTKYGRSHKIEGYSELRERARHTVVFRCPDSACEYGGDPITKPSARPMPICVIDEDLLKDPPDLVIGTVDKFAQLTWREDARSLFGISGEGRQSASPPRLIIQDELHLISGPLGSMVGAYETVIESLCTAKDGGKPKIVASTATISRADEQIKNLYARERAFLFPPSGLTADDSFFAREARDREGQLLPGRVYVGVLAPAHGSLQTTQVRCFSSLLQNTLSLSQDPELLDPWWTLLVFFNSIRELGGAATLFVSDIREYLRVLLNRSGAPPQQVRYTNVVELTSRIRSDEVPKVLAELESALKPTGGPRSRTGSGKVVDVCLASNIIEVGVDVSRLGLMAVVGQPKTTSQYIQVTSRVGRSAKKPGLVIVLYGQSKPRDRSHYERFRSYHQKLYAQVEPTSVTPFSPPAAERALHGLIVALVRQLGRISHEARASRPFPLAKGSGLRQMVDSIIGTRVNNVAPVEYDNVMKLLEKRLEEWSAWDPGEYGHHGTPPQNAPLLHPAGSHVPTQWNNHSWPTLSSLRNVDANCEAAVTGFFNSAPADTP